MYSINMQKLKGKAITQYNSEIKVPPKIRNKVYFYIILLGFLRKKMRQLRIKP